MRIDEYISYKPTCNGVPKGLLRCTGIGRGRCPQKYFLPGTAGQPFLLSCCNFFPLLSLRRRMGKGWPGDWGKVFVKPHGQNCV